MQRCCCSLAVRQSEARTWVRGGEAAASSAIVSAATVSAPPPLPSLSLLSAPSGSRLQQVVRLSGLFHQVPSKQTVCLFLQPRHAECLQGVTCVVQCGGHAIAHRLAPERLPPPSLSQASRANSASGSPPPSPAAAARAAASCRPPREDSSSRCCCYKSALIWHTQAA